MSSSRHLTIRKASAGSGKTYQLAYNFIRLMLGRRDKSTGKWHLTAADAQNAHRHILAITFTNKATDEMKRRIVRELAIIAKAPMMEGQTSKYKGELMTDFGLEDESYLTDAARKALRELLFDYAEFNVSTIDAFFQSVLRSFAYEADLSGNYEVSLDSDAMVESGISETIADAIMEKGAEGRMLKRWLEGFMTEGYRRGNSFNLLNNQGATRAMLREFISSLTDETYHHHASEINAFIGRDSTTGENPVAELQTKLTTRQMEIMQEAVAMAAGLLEAHEDILEGRSVVAFLKKVIKGSFAPSAKAKEYIVEPGLCFKSKAKSKPPEVQARLNGLLDMCGMISTIGLLLKHIHSFGVFDAVCRSISRIKADANTILLSDTNSLLRRIIGDDTAPFLYERTGMRLRHFLIDEFQDTSRLQWQNLKPLVAESLSHNNDNLIIGDVKQCIYRFRNSDPQLLGSDLENDPELTSHVDLIFQSTNYRSARQIVEFNNALFPQLAQELGHAAVYPPETDPLRDGAPDGYVDLEVLPDQDYTQIALDRMFANICRELDPEQGAYRPADIAVLTRYNSEAAEVVEFLMEHLATTPGLEHVKVVSDESLMLNTSPAVRRVIAELSNRSVLPQPSSRQADSHYQTVSQNQFDWISAEFDRRRMQDCADPFDALRDLLEEFNADHGIASGHEVNDQPMPLPLLVAEAIGHLPEDLRRRDSIYLFALLDLVGDYCQTGSPSLHSFLEWWRMTGNSRCITSSPSADAITVMTVHKAKGLEYDCVHIPFTPKSFGKESDVRWYDCGSGAGSLFALLGISEPVPRFYPLKSEKAMAEADTYFSGQYNRLLDESRLDDLNVLYVAFTRPVRELIVSLPEKNKKETSDNTTTLIASVLQPTEPIWHYTSGMPTQRIVTELRHDPDAPTTVDMAEIIPPRHPMTAIIAEISDETNI